MVGDPAAEVTSGILVPLHWVFRRLWYVPSPQHIPASIPELSVSTRALPRAEL